jgi:anaerobic ribonucleoside-triphosphate reductase
MFKIEGNDFFLRQSFSKNFVDVMNEIHSKYPEILKIEALDSNSLDIPRRFDEYHAEDVTVSGEENANVGKSIHPSHRNGKIYEGFEKIKSYYMVYDTIEKAYGTETANDAIREMLIGSCGVHDSAGMDIPYCVAYSTSWLMREGRSYITDVPNVPPNHFKSYMNMSIESMFDACAEFCGATVIFDLLIGMAYYTRQVREARHAAIDYPGDIITKLRMLALDLVSAKKHYKDAYKEVLDKYEEEKSLIRVADYVLNREIENTLQGFVHLVGNKFRNGYQSMFTNLSLFSPRILKDNFAYYRYPNNDKIDNYIDEIIELQLIFAGFFSQGIRGTKNTRIVAMPVVTLMVPNDNIGGETLQEKDDLFIDKVLSLFSKFNNINVYRGIKLALCCRLLVEKKNDTAVGVNSLGVASHNDGNNAVGSLRVATFNLANIALELLTSHKFRILHHQMGNCTSQEGKILAYLDLLDKKLTIGEKILNAQRALIYQRNEQGFLKLSQAGWVNLEKLASTFGGVGLYEAIKILNDGEYGSAYTKEDLELGNKILLAFENKCVEASKRNGVIFNMEVSVPAESMAFRFANRDRSIFGKENIPYKELSNQFTPLTLDFGVSKKLEWENELSSLVAPTGICHVNVEGELTPEKNIEIHRKIWAKFPSVQHYALNSTIYNCENNHNKQTKRTDGTCTECGGKITDYVTRSIGYFRSIPFEFGKNRAEEYTRRKWFTTQSIGEAVKE